MQKKGMPQVGSGSLLVGLLPSLASYTTGVLLHNFIPALPIYVDMILCITATEGFSALPGEMEKVVTAWGQFVIRTFTTAALTGISIVLLDLNRPALVLTLPYLLTIVFGVFIITLTTDFVGSRLMGSHPLETSIVVDICTTNVGGSGSIAVLSVADRMLLLPSAQTVARNTGALVLTLGGILAAILLRWAPLLLFLAQPEIRIVANVKMC